MKVKRHEFILPLEKGKCSDISLGSFTPGKEHPGNHWIGGWVGPVAGLDAVEKNKIASPRRSRP